MGIIYSYDRQGDIIFLVWDGKVTWEDWLAHIHKLQAEPDWTSISRVIADLRTANDTSSMGNWEIDQAADIFGSQRNILSRKRIAVIARDEFGKAKRFGDAISKFGAIFIVFNNLNTACLFMGMDEQEARRSSMNCVPPCCRVPRERRRTIPTKKLRECYRQQIKHTHAIHCI